MKKIIKKIYLLVLAAPATSFAAIGPGNCPDALNTGSTTNPCASDLTVLITNISNTILLVVGVVAVLFLIVGGFQYITSAGNPETVGKAKTTILYAIIGLIVVLLSWGVINFIIGHF